MLKQPLARKMLLLFIAANFVGLPACAQTQSAPKAPGTATFEQMDTNGDGQVVLEEFRAKFPNMNEKAFVVLDKDGSNGIERAEWYEFIENHAMGKKPQNMRDGSSMNNIPGDALIPPPDSSDLPLVRPPQGM